MLFAGCGHPGNKSAGYVSHSKHDCDCDCSRSHGDPLSVLPQRSVCERAIPSGHGDRPCHWRYCGQCLPVPAIRLRAVSLTVCPLPQVSTDVVTVTLLPGLNSVPNVSPALSYSPSSTLLSLLAGGDNIAWDNGVRNISVMFNLYNPGVTPQGTVTLAAFCN